MQFLVWIKFLMIVKKKRNHEYGKHSLMLVSMKFIISLVRHRKESIRLYNLIFIILLISLYNFLNELLHDELM